MPEAASAIPPLEKSLGDLERVAALFLAADPLDLADEVDALAGATNELHQAVDGLRGELEEVEDSLRAIGTVFAGGGADIARDLVERCETEASEIAREADEARQTVEALFETLAEMASDELKDWFSDASQQLAQQLQEAVGELQEVADQTLDSLKSALSAAITEVRDDIAERVREKCAGAVDSVVRAVVDRALAEVAETLVTSQMGAAITSAIGPYLPAIIALRHSVGAIQQALNVMRMGT